MKGVFIGMVVMLADKAVITVVVLLTVEFMLGHHPLWQKIVVGVLFLIARTSRQMAVAQIQESFARFRIKRLMDRLSGAEKEA